MPMTRLTKAVKPRLGADVARALPAALGNILVFLLVGVWHGASMNYVLWGLYNGLILAASALLEPLYKRANDRLGERVVRSRGFYALRILRTFVIVNIGWYFDRALRAGDAFAMLGKTFFSPAFAQLSDGTLLTLGLTAGDFKILAAAALILFAVSVLQERGVRIRDSLLSLPVIPRIVLLYAFMYFVLANFLTSNAASVSFMYAVF